MKVDKSFWQKKTLSDFFDLKMGKTPSRKDLSLWEEGDTPWVSISDMKDTHFISGAKESLSMATIAQCRIPIIPIGTVIMSFKLTIGKTCIVAKPLVTNEAIMAFYPKEGVEVNSSFLAYALSALKWKGNRAVKGITINKKTISNKLFSLPPLNLQETIASELDALQEIIDGYKAQISDLVALAQSIFLDTFGDPLTNPKGWKIEKLANLGSIARGVSKHRPRNAPELLGGIMPLIQTGDIANAGLFINSYIATYSELGVSQSKIWSKGTLCITIAANIGKTAIMTFDACFPDSVVGFTADSSKCSVIFVLFCFKTIQKSLEDNAGGIAQKNINLAVLNSLKVPAPPIELQQQFASQVEAIEQQKELLRQQLADAEMLMAERMQYYFS